MGEMLHPQVLRDETPRGACRLIPMDGHELGCFRGKSEEHLPPAPHAKDHELHHS